MQLRSSYNAAEFRRLAGRESDQVELKAGVGQDPLQEALVAMSNSGGGVIFAEKGTEDIWASIEANRDAPNDTILTFTGRFSPHLRLSPGRAT